jgi:hypothetical protein
VGDKGWSRLEVEATVADYLAMLAEEVSGQAYSKAEHRRGLARLLDRRSDAAIERKHQNISAILIDFGVPYINGYKPLHNYQGLLREVVQARLQSSPELLGRLATAAAEPAVVPSVDDILAALVPPPVGDPVAATAPPVPRERTFPDYVSQEAANRSLGLAGEEFVVRYEQARLLAAGKERLAASVEHVSQSRGDGAGYDIHSFEADGRDRLVEVKTTAGGVYTPFYLSRNELEVSRERAKQYFLYRAFQFRTQPRLFMRQGPLDRSFVIEPSQWIASVAAARATAAGSGR